MGVVSNLPPPYTTGTVSGAAQAAVLTGAGTTWTVTDANGNTVGQVFPGDLVIIPGMPFPNPILSVDSATQITLEIPLPAAVSGSAYRIRRYAPQPQGAVLGTVLDLLNQGTDKVPDISRTFDGGTGRLKIRASASGGMSVSAGGSGALDAALVEALKINPDGGVSIGNLLLKRVDALPSLYFTDASHYLSFDGGKFQFTGGNLVVNGDLFSRRPDLSGVLYLGDLGHYLYWDKTNFNLIGAPLLVNSLYVGGSSASLLTANEYVMAARNRANTAYVNFYAGDHHADRGDGTGVYYFGPGSTYLYFDGTNFLFNGGNVYGPSFTNNSDYRLKINSKRLEGASALLASVKVYEGEFADAPGVKRQYVFAHEAQEAGPPNVAFGQKDAVNENGEPVYQGVDYTRYVPALIAATQEQAKLIAQLTRELELIKDRLATP